MSSFHRDKIGALLSQRISRATGATDRVVSTFVCARLWRAR